MVDRFLEYMFLYQVLSGLYVRFSMFIRTSGLDYLESIHIFTHTAQYSFLYIYRSLYFHSTFTLQFICHKLTSFSYGPSWVLRVYMLCFVS